MTTEFFVEYGLYDTTALQDARESTESNAPFADIKLIKENSPVPRYATLEHNYFVLDGSAAEFPDEPDGIAYYSKDFVCQNDNFWYAGSEIYSGDDMDGPCNEIYEGQSIIIQFTQNHTSYGLTLHFMNDYPLELEIGWYDLAGIIKSRMRFCPNACTFFCKNPVVEYGKIEIRFLKALPYHNVKLQGIEYGTTVTWGRDNIKSGRLLNDTDMTSDKIMTDKLTYEFVDTEDEFNFGNPSGVYKVFQRNQKMLPYEMVSGEKIVLGAFFLDDISTEKSVTKISAIDYKGKLADVDFIEGKMYSGELAGVVINEIMAAAGIKDYEIDTETSNTPLYGTLKIQSCQKALREVLFACGSIINTSHRLGIEIRKADRVISARISRSRKFTTSYQIDKYVSDVNVKYKTWKLEEKGSLITKGMYDAGIHMIQLSSPVAEMTANTGTIIKQTPYYIILQVSDKATEVVVSGRKYIGEELTLTASVKHIKSGEVRSVKKYNGAMLNFEAAKRVADSILDYYSLQQIIKTKHLASNEKVGDWAEIQNDKSLYGDFVAGIESLSTDLTGGFICTSKCRGYFQVSVDQYFSGNQELYTDEGAGEII